VPPETRLREVIGHLTCATGATEAIADIMADITM
jgi:hypothetical protein